MVDRVDPDGINLRDLRDRAREARDANGSRSNPYVPWRTFQKLVEEIDPAFLVSLCDDYQHACGEVERLRARVEELTNGEETP